MPIYFPNIHKDLLYMFSYWKICVDELEPETKKSLCFFRLDKAHVTIYVAQPGLYGYRETLLIAIEKALL